MNNQLITALTPTDKTGELDQRFQKSVLNAFSSVKPTVLQRLGEFMEKQQSLEKDFHRDAFEIALAFNNEAKSLESNRDDYGRLQTGRADKLRESVRKGLQNLGFKSGNASKISLAAEFATSRVGFSAIDKWLAGLGVSHLHVLSRMSEKGIEAAAKEVSYEDFHLCAGAKDISVRRLEQIQKQFPRDSGCSDPPETSGAMANKPLNQTKEQQQTHEVAFLPTHYGEPDEIPTNNVFAEVLGEPEQAEESYEEKRERVLQLFSNYEFWERFLLEDDCNSELNPHNSLLETLAEQSRSTMPDWRPTYV